MDFNNLVSTIAAIHRQTLAHAVKSVNVALTLRNWLIGGCIHEFELHGADRAAYGNALFGKIAEQLTSQDVPNCSKSRLYRYRDFYVFYPQIVATVPPQFAALLSTGDSKPTPQKVATLSPLSGKLILERLSYSHFELLLEIVDTLKRTFYETECINGNWSVRELKRQINTLYFERSGLSKNKEKLFNLANADALLLAPQDIIRDPCVFEFLGLRPSEIFPENKLEAALLEKVQQFLLELGHGFCFEARQKRILIGGEYFFIDLVFYHRVLKCHVLVELKVDAFQHEHLGQLNTYVNYFRTNEMTAGDQPPIGILLCTAKNQELVQFALAGMDNNLFVSKYQLELPTVETLKEYLARQREEIAPENSPDVTGV
ncbi:MAG: PDDEXK nuclease domain-containing protein [Puniceicoccales bacterium]|jgi:predicted nuclease of restriction endonuclease-like (RecB) superfamily|nr:PDDEXK nuclease domain-containing protein [Puniceicoccales bacterium]